MGMVNAVAKNITENEYKIMHKFFPGPLTIILNKKDIIPEIVTSEHDTVGVRIPNDEIALKLIEYAGVPIATTSANISGNSSGTDIDSIINEFEDKVDYYIDGGKSKLGLGSTIVKVVEGVPNILRQGSIIKEEIENIDF